MGSKATFDAVNKLITLIEVPTNNQVNLSTAIDLYSDAKEDWQSDSILKKFTFPFRVIGGDDLGGGLTAGSYFFLRNDLGWRIKPYEDDHELTVDGNLYANDPNTVIFRPTTGAYTVSVRLSTSSLTQQTAGTDPSSLATAVRSELTPELTLMDASVSSRATQTSVDNVQTDIDAIEVTLANISSVIDDILKYGKNNTKIDAVNKQLVIYDNDGIAEIKRYDLKDRDGVASIVEIFERIAV